MGVAVGADVGVSRCGCRSLCGCVVVGVACCAGAWTFECVWAGLCAANFPKLQAEFFSFKFLVRTKNSKLKKLFKL